MNVQPHLNIFNPHPPSQQDSIAFPQFKLLLPELRHEIWRWGMSRSGLVSLYIYLPLNKSAENHRVAGYILLDLILEFN